MLVEFVLSEELDEFDEALHPESNKTTAKMGAKVVFRGITFLSSPMSLFVHQVDGHVFPRVPRCISLVASFVMNIC